MAKAFLNIAKLNKFEHIDLIIKKDVQISIHPKYLILRQKEEGKTKNYTISRETWFSVVEFSELIKACFLMDNKSEKSDDKPKK